MHVDLDAVGMPCADADEQVLHQPAIFIVAGFEFRHRAEIDLRGIDGFALGDPVQNSLWPEADAGILDVDDRAVVQLKSVFCFELGKAVRANDLEVRADGKDRAFDAWPKNFAAEDRNDAADAMAEIAGEDRRADLDGEAEDISCLKLARHGRPFFRRVFFTRTGGHFARKRFSAPSCAAAARSRAAETRSGSRRSEE